MPLLSLLLQELLLVHPLASVLNVTREPESATLMFTFRGDMTEFKVQVDSPAHAWEMVNVLEQCKGDRMVSYIVNNIKNILFLLAFLHSVSLFIWDEVTCTIAI